LYLFEQFNHIDMVVKAEIIDRKYTARNALGAERLGTQTLPIVWPDPVANCQELRAEPLSTDWAPRRSATNACRGARHADTPLKIGRVLWFWPNDGEFV